MVMDDHASAKMSQQNRRRTAKRSSYFETLSSVTSQLDFMREDLSSSSHAFEYSPMSPLDLGSNLRVQTADLLCGKQPQQPQPLKQRGIPAGYDSLPLKITVTNEPTDSGSKVYSDVFKFPVPPPPSKEQEPHPKMTMGSRIVHSKLVWYLPRIYRAAAVHYLQGQQTGTFIVRSSSRPGELCLSMRHPGTAGGAFIEHFNIIALTNGYRLDQEDEIFSSLDDLILHHCTNRGALPCPLDIPQALKTARTSAELQSLAILEEEFWKSPHSRVPCLQQSSQKSQLTGSTAFMLTIQRNSPLPSNDLMDTRETKDRILSLYGTENTKNINRHSWSSDTLSGHNHHWNKSNHGHRRAVSDANRQIMRYSNDEEQLDLSYLQRPPPPTCAPPLPPLDAQLPFFQDSSNQSCTVIPRNSGRNLFKQVRALSSEGSSERSQSTISEDSLGRDSICSSSSFSSHSRQSNSSLSAISDPLSRLSEQFSNQQPQVRLEDPGALMKESPYDTPKVTGTSDVVAHRDTQTKTFSAEDLDILDFSSLASRGVVKGPVTPSTTTAVSTLFEFDPLLVAPPPEFGDYVTDGAVQTSSEWSEEHNTVANENILVNFDSDGNLQLSRSELSGDVNFPTEENSSVKKNSFNSEQSINSELSGLCSSIPTAGNSSIKRDSASSDQSGSSSLSGEYELIASGHSAEEKSNSSGVNRNSSEMGKKSGQSTGENSPVNRNSHISLQHSSSGSSGKYHIPSSEHSPVKSDSGSQHSNSGSSGKYHIPSSEHSPVKSGTNSQRSSSGSSGKYHIPSSEHSPVKSGTGSQHSSSGSSGKYHLTSSEHSPIKSGTNSQRSSSGSSGKYHLPSSEHSPVKTESGSQHSSSGSSGKYHLPSSENSPAKSGTGSQRSSSGSSGKYHISTGDTSPVKTDSGSQRSSSESSWEYHIPSHGSWSIKPGSYIQNSSSESSGKYHSPTRESSLLKTVSNSQHSSSESSGKYHSPTCESSLLKTDSNSQNSSSESSGKYHSPTHVSSPIKTGNNGSDQGSSYHSSGEYVLITSEKPSTQRDSTGSADRSSSELSGVYKRVDSGSSPARINIPHVIQRSSSEMSSEFDVAGSMSLPVSIGEPGTDDEEGVHAGRMKRCISLPAAYIRGTNEDGVFQGSKSVLFSEEVPEELLGGDEEFEFVSHPAWSSENLNSNRSFDESSSTAKSKKGRTFRHIKHMAKKSTKKVHRKIRPSWNKKLEILDPAASIQEVVKRLASDPTTRLGAMVDSFISSTGDKCESHPPDAVLKSLRQFMSGVKNYLFNDQEKEVEAQLDKYCNLTGIEVDAIFEGALHQILLEPLKDQIYLCFIKHFNQSESLKLLDRNIRSAKEKSSDELGIRDNFVPPSRAAMLSIKERFTDIQKAFSPLQKLEYLLHVVREIYSSVSDSALGSNAVTSMGADDFLPMLIYALVHCDQIHIEIEVEYMWGLLDPSMLSGEGGYYLTTLSSAICVLKQFEEETECETKGFVTVFVAKSSQPGDIIMKTVPVLPAMTAVEVCNVIIQKLNLDPETPHHIFLLDHGKELHIESHCSIYKVKTDYEAVNNQLCKFCIRAEDVVVTWPAISVNVQASV